MRGSQKPKGARAPDHLDARGDRRVASGSAGRSVGEGKMGGGADPLPRRPTAFTSATLQAGDSSDAEDEATRTMIQEWADNFSPEHLKPLRDYFASACNCNFKLLSAIEFAEGLFKTIHVGSEDLA